MMLTHVNDAESKNVPRFIASWLSALTEILKYGGEEKQNEMEKFVNSIIELILKTDYLNSENTEVLFHCL